MVFKLTASPILYQFFYTVVSIKNSMLWNDMIYWTLHMAHARPFAIPVADNGDNRITSGDKPILIQKFFNKK